MRETLLIDGAFEKQRERKGFESLLQSAEFHLLLKVKGVISKDSGRGVWGSLI